MPLFVGLSLELGRLTDLELEVGCVVARLTHSTALGWMDHPQPALPPSHFICSCTNQQAECSQYYSAEQELGNFVFFPLITKPSMKVRYKPRYDSYRVWQMRSIYTELTVIMVTFIRTYIVLHLRSPCSLPASSQLLQLSMKRRQIIQRYFPSSFHR